MKAFKDYDISNKRNSGFLTGGIVGAIVGITFLLGFKPPDPPMVEPEGLLVDFGTSETGLGLLEPDNMTSAPSQPVSAVKQEVVTQKAESAIKVPDNKNNDKPKTNTSTTTTNTKPTINQEELFPPGKIDNKGQTGTSEGTSTYGGNQGIETGDPNGYQGPGSGIGDDGTTGWNLNGRNAKTKAPLTVEHNESGDIRIKIYVDRNGHVTKAEYERSGSTITNTYLVGKSKEAAMKWSFNADKNSPETQIGYITFHFKLQ